MGCGLSSDAWDDADGVFGKEDGNSSGHFSSSAKSNYFFWLTRTKFAREKLNRENRIARVANTEINADDCV